MQKGNIGITTENIFPVIKKFLYSDHEIFLRELVSNAVDATQKLKTYAMRGDFKGDLGDLTIRVSVDKEAKTLTISDRGIGMTAEEKARAFERFYRADKSRNTPGSGLGLSLVHAIVGFYNGTIAVESAPNRGTVFTITLS